MGNVNLYLFSSLMERYLISCTWREAVRFCSRSGLVYAAMFGILLMELPRLIFKTIPLYIFHVSIHTYRFALFIVYWCFRNQDFVQEINQWKKLTSSWIVLTLRTPSICQRDTPGSDTWVLIKSRLNVYFFLSFNGYLAGLVSAMPPAWESWHFYSLPCLVQ